MFETLSGNNRGKFFLSFASGLFGATVTIGTTWCTRQLVDIVGAAVLYFNGLRFVAAAIVFSLFKADYSITISHCRMAIFQPTWEASTTPVYVSWTCGSHFCPCSSLESIPAIEGAVTFRESRYVGFFSFCIV